MKTEAPILEIFDRAREAASAQHRLLSEFHARRFQKQEVVLSIDIIETRHPRLGNLTKVAPECAAEAMETWAPHDQALWDDIRVNGLSRPPIMTQDCYLAAGTRRFVICASLGAWIHYHGKKGRGWRVIQLPQTLDELSDEDIARIRANDEAITRDEIKASRQLWHRPAGWQPPVVVAGESSDDQESRRPSLRDTVNQFLGQPVKPKQSYYEALRRE